MSTPEINITAVPQVEAFFAWVDESTPSFSGCYVEPDSSVVECSSVADDAAPLDLSSGRPSRQKRKPGSPAPRRARLRYRTVKVVG